MSVGLIVVRYAEMGLKGRPVRQRFERILLDNMMESIVSEGIEALISKDRGRIYVTSENDERAVNSLSKVFGVSSLSPVLECRAEMEEIKRVAADRSKELIGQGQSFAVRSRREGVHRFTSMDLNREVGSAIWEANEGKGIRVNLQSPDVKIFVEVRGSRAFVFDRVIAGPGGLPMGSQGKVMAFVGETKDLLAAWLMMKRGCRVALLTEDPPLVEPLTRWDPHLRVESASNQQYLIEVWGALGAVYGLTYDELRGKSFQQGLPNFFPLVGLDDEEIERRLQIVMA